MDKTGAARPGEIDDLLIMQQYPSPAADAAADAQATVVGNDYYDSALQIHRLAQHSIDEAAKMKTEQVPPSPSTQDQNQHSSVSAEELQLAAQLTQGLAPMMAAAAAQSEAEVEVEVARLENHNHEPSFPQETEHAHAPPQEPQTTPQGHEQASEQIPPQGHEQPLEQPLEQPFEQPLESRDQSHGSPNTTSLTSLDSQPDQDVQMQDATPHSNGESHHESDVSMQHPDSLPQPDASQLQLLQDQGNGLERHEPNLHNNAIPPQNHQQPHLQPVQPHLQPVQPHPHPPPHPGPYVDAAQHQAHLPPHLQMSQMPQHAYNGVPVDNSIPPRKRSKVSRACDECRRKKVKCDAISETGETACTNCRRSQIRCDFSRIPQKRGPSKGYIKELADRINSIEGKLGNQSLSAADFGLDYSPSAPRRESAEDFSPSSQLNENAKRPFSGISADGLGTSIAPAKPAGWSSEPRPIHPYPPPSAERFSKPIFSVNDLAPRLAPAPAPEPNTPSKALPAAPPPPEVEPLPSVDDVSEFREIDDHVFHGYLTIIHPSFPILAGVKAIVQSNIAKCPHTLQCAFFEALVATMQSFHAMPAGVTGDARIANRWLADWEADPGDSLGSSLAELVHLQTLLLLAIEADNHGPAAVKGKHGAPSKTSFLARAVAVAYAMDLRSKQLDVAFELDSEPDADAKVALRAWWSLVALDRFNAIGTAQPLLIPQTGIQPTSALRNLLGEAGHHFIKLAYILGYYVDVLMAAQIPISSPFGQHQQQTWAGLAVGLEMWRMDFPSTITPTTDPVVHFAYWHCRLIAYLLLPQTRAEDVLWAARSLLDDLAANHVALSPLNHNVTTLVAICLAELTKVDRTRDEARRLITGGLLSGNIAPSTWDGPVSQMVSLLDARPSTSEGIEAMAGQSLKQLADLAAATATTEMVNAVKAAAEIDIDDPANRQLLLQQLEYKHRHQQQQQQQQEEQQTAPPEPALQEPPKLDGDYADLGFDPRPMLRAGYLNAVVRPAV